MCFAAEVDLVAGLAVGAIGIDAVRHVRRSADLPLALLPVVLTYAVVRGPVHAEIEGHHLAYSVDVWQGGMIVALYVMATCGSMLISSHEHVRWFGSVNLVVVVLLVWLDQSAFISLWCVWAAVTSVAIAVHLRQAGQLTHHSTG